MLEVGCGPATATVDFAQFGCSMLCLEPDPNFYKLAQQNCRHYPKVEIRNTAFEEWMLEVGKFDAVLAASSFHWIPANIGYPKAAQALHPKGCLILLWNKELQPTYEVHQHLSAIYQAHAPSLAKFEDTKTQEKILQGLGQMIADSGYFQNIVSDSVESEVIYSTDEYLMLLNTYSPYLKLDPQTREALFSGLSSRIESDFGGRLQLSYISAFHIAQRKP
ncbi:MAG: class I SAM-dependent methyltransferase [Cyanobacteria bacterium J06636_16]